MCIWLARLRLLILVDSVYFGCRLSELVGLLGHPTVNIIWPWSPANEQMNSPTAYCRVWIIRRREIPDWLGVHDWDNVCMTRLLHTFFLGVIWVMIARRTDEMSISCSIVHSWGYWHFLYLHGLGHVRRVESVWHGSYRVCWVSCAWYGCCTTSHNYRHIF